MKLSKQKDSLRSAIEKLRKSQNFGSDCNLNADEAYVVLQLLTKTAARIDEIQSTEKRYR